MVLSFAQNHLCMMLCVDKNNKGRWMPALNFDGHKQAQTRILQQENFEGKDKMQNELAGFTFVHLLSKESTISGRLAVVLGDVAMKRVFLREEQIL
jgi:hypothetical protein